MTSTIVLAAQGLPRALAVPQCPPNCGHLARPGPGHEGIGWGHPVCWSLQVQHQPGSSSHCPFLHLIHEHYPPVAGLFTSTISISLLQTLRKPGASKTSWAGGPEHKLGTLPRAGMRGKLGRSKMVLTRLCTKSCPGTGCSRLSPALQRTRGSAGALTRAELARGAGRELLG